MATSFRFLRRRRQLKGSKAPQPAFFGPLSGQRAAAGEQFFAPANAWVQAKLTVNQPGDAHEQEADKMAEHVVQRAQMKSEEEKMQRKARREDEDAVRRKTGPEEEKLRKKDAKEEEKPIQKLPTAAGAAPVAAPISAHQLSATKGQGSALPAATRAEMAQAFGHDFHNVRIHTTSRAEQLSQDLQAQAFTHGADVYFGPGKYNPDTSDGKRLLAHELAHVVQQSGRAPEQLQRYPVPGQLACAAVVPWLNANSPYAPEWAETRCTYRFRGNVRVRFETLPGGRVRATASGSPRLGVGVSCPIDSPTWTPGPREYRAPEVAAWQAMKAQLMAHEREHRRLGEQGRATLQANYQAVRFDVTGADQADAGQLAQARLVELQQQWTAAAQADQDAIDPFRGANLACP